MHQNCQERTFSDLNWAPVPYPKLGGHTHPPTPALPEPQVVGGPIAADASTVRPNRSTGAKSATLDPWKKRNVWIEPDPPRRLRGGSLMCPPKKNTKRLHVIDVLLR